MLRDLELHQYGAEAADTLIFYVKKTMSHKFVVQGNRSMIRAISESSRNSVIIPNWSSLNGCFFNETRPRIKLQCSL